MKKEIENFKDVQRELSDISTTIEDQLYFVVDAIEELKKKVIDDEMSYESFFYEVLPLVKIVRAIARQGAEDFLSLFNDVRKLNEETKTLPAA